MRRIILPFLHSTCLKPTYSLRKQLITSFGLLTFLTIGIVVMISIVCGIVAGRYVKENSRSMIKDQVLASMDDSSRYTADILAEMFKHYRSSAAIVVEIVQDRIVGYAGSVDDDDDYESEQGYKDDRYVPFTDYDGTNKYPLKSKPLPRDWELDFNINEQNANNHLPSRAKLAKLLNYKLSTASAMYSFQGNCDPSATLSTSTRQSSSPYNPSSDLSSWGYFPNCTIENNNVTTGGIIQPTETNRFLAEKAADIGTLLKPLIEIEADALRAGVYFHNSGAGSTLTFPGIMIHPVADSYVSNGCEWMNSPNPILLKNENVFEPIGTDDDIIKCHKNGSDVNGREYNPMEESWCSKQALEPNKMHIIGPMLGPSNIWILRVGKAIYDRKTKHFIACMSVDYTLDGIERILRQSKEGSQEHGHDENINKNCIQQNIDGGGNDAIQNCGNSSRSVRRAEYSTVALIRSDGTVVAGSGWDFKPANGTVHVKDTEFMNADTFEEINKMVFDSTAGFLSDFSTPANDVNDSHSYDRHVVKSSDGKYYSVYVVKASPVTNDGNNNDNNQQLWQPDFLVIQMHREKDIFRVIDQMDTTIEGEISNFIGIAFVVGFVGSAILIFDISVVVHVLTRPMLWIDKVSRWIVNQKESTSVASEYFHSRNDTTINRDDIIANELFLIDTELIDVTQRIEKDAPIIEGPKTEISDLVAEFQSMVHGFSGEGASCVASPLNQEVRNFVTWKRDYKNLYNELNESVQQGLDLNTIHESLNDSCGYLQEEDSPPEFRSVELSDRNEMNKMFNSLSSLKMSSQRSFLQEDENPNPTAKGGLDRLWESTSQSISMYESTAFQSTAFQSRLNSGRNIYSGSGSRMSLLPERAPEYCVVDEISTLRSSLFRWLAVLIVIPLVVTTLILCYMASRGITSTLPSLAYYAESSSLSVAEDALDTAASLRALFIEQVLADPLRDLYISTRVAGWLLFNGIQRNTDCFVEALSQPTEDCKFYPADMSCPFYHSNELPPCDCKYKDEWNQQCRWYNTDTRFLQKAYFVVQAQDYDPITGNRNNSQSFPPVASSPNTTVWWTDPSTMPGSYKGSNASGFETLYDRLRVISALSTVNFPILNYAAHMEKSKALGAEFAFEADGLHWTYSGCNVGMAQWSHFKSTEGNGAAKVRPELCPINKHGYDPRCRPWYASGVDTLQEDGASFYITAPYYIATSDLTGTSAGSAIINERDGVKELVGQTVLIFTPHEFESALLNRTKSEFTIVITPSDDYTAGDTILGPGHALRDPPARIQDVLFPDNGDDSRNTNSSEFMNNIVRNMKLGKHGVHSFRRYNKKLEEDEWIRMSYEPVEVGKLNPISANDYKTGVTRHNTLVYSVGVASLEKSLRKPFKNIEEAINTQLRNLVLLCLCLVIIVLILSSISACHVSFALTNPLLILLRVVRSINSGNIDDDVPPLKGGSKEVNRVYTSFSKLHRIVRASNNAFFSGNLDLACRYLQDALLLYRKLGDRKAVAIACNNVGNVMLTMSCENKKSTRLGPRSCYMLNGSCCVKTSLDHFNEAIKIGTEDLENGENPVAVKAELAQQLADRYFNRGLLYLHCSSDPCIYAVGGTCGNASPEELGWADIAKAKELDYDVRDFLLEKKLLFQCSDVYYNRLLRRIHGLIPFCTDKRSKNIWDVENIFIDAGKILVSAAEDEQKAPIFDSVKRIGRLQELEAAMIEYELKNNNLDGAAMRAMRMFVEDDYILASSYVTAANAILGYMRNEGTSKLWSKETIATTTSQILKMLKSCKTNSLLNTEKCVILCVEISDTWKGHPVLNKIQCNNLLLYDEACDNRDYFGVVAFSDIRDCDVTLRLEKKDSDRQREMVKQASLTTNGNSSTECQVLHFAVNMLVGSNCSSLNDSFIILITDGCSYDSEAFSLARVRLDTLNRERGTTVHVIIIGLDIPSQEISSEYRSLCPHTRYSAYFDASVASIDETYQKIASMVSGRSAGNLVPGITMEKF